MGSSLLFELCLVGAEHYVQKRGRETGVVALVVAVVHNQRVRSAARLRLRTYM